MQKYTPDAARPLWDSSRPARVADVKWRAAQEPRRRGSGAKPVEGWRVLTPARRIIYSLGGFGSSLLLQTVLLWVFYYYAPPPDQALPARVTPALLGLAMGLGRLVEALVNPLVAHWSDRRRGRGGRRRPVILLGAPLMAIAFALLWRPPDASITPANFIYLSVWLGVFFLMFTLVLNPYMALLPESTQPGRDRVSTSAWQSVFTLTGTAVAFVASAQLAARAGFPMMGLILAPLGFLPLLVAGLAVRERAIADVRVNLVPALRAATGNRLFRIYIAGLALLWLGLSTVSLAMALIVTVLMGLPRAAVGTVLGVSVAARVAATPLVTSLAHRIGSHRALLSAMSLAGVLLPLLATIGLWPVPLSAPVQGYVLVALASPSLAALFVLPNALLADITQTSTGETGQRLEGMFFAFQGLMLNGATSVSSAALGLFGYTVGLRIAPLLAAACVAAGIAVFRRLPSG